MNTYIKGLTFDRPHPFRMDADRLNTQFHTDAFVQPNGVVRWRVNNRIPPKDILEFWNYLNKPFDYVLSNETRQTEEAQVLANYREVSKNRKPSAEEMYEMRSAFGRGTTAVNVLTGKRTKL